MLFHFILREPNSYFKNWTYKAVFPNLLWRHSWLQFTTGEKVLSGGTSRTTCCCEPLVKGNKIVSRTEHESFITFCQKESFEIVSQRDGDDGEICGQGEDWEEAEEVMNDCQIPRLPLHRGKVEGV